MYLLPIFNLYFLSMGVTTYNAQIKDFMADVKAPNAGGVATSGLQMFQNFLRLNWSREEVDQKLQTIMKYIHKACVTYEYDNSSQKTDYVKVANAMMEQGLV